MPDYLSVLIKYYTSTRPLLEIFRGCQIEKDAAQIRDIIVMVPKKECIDLWSSIQKMYLRIFLRFRLWQLEGKIKESFDIALSLRIDALLKFLEEEQI